MTYNSSTMTCFFYGTLMHPDILSKVIKRSSAELLIKNASLFGYSRHRVKDADYPGIIRADAAKFVIGRDLLPEEAVVKGVVCSGLLPQDIVLLDEFEGDEYTRKVTEVQIVSEDDQQSEKKVKCEIYEWTAPLQQLESHIWHYEDFLRDKAHVWVKSETEPEIQGSSNLAYTLGQDNMPIFNYSVSPPPFGKAIAQRFWSFDSNWLNMNHGSLGSCPNVVINTFRACQDQLQRAPDKFMKRHIFASLKDIFSRISKTLHCDAQDLTLCPNLSSGLYAVLRSIPWGQNDAILYYASSIDPSNKRVLQYFAKANEYLNINLIPVDHSYQDKTSNDDNNLILNTKAVISSAFESNTRIKLALVDTFGSFPGVHLPWQQLCDIFIQNQIMTLVDGSHSMGQEEINLEHVKPDFWLSDIHRWLFSHPSAVILYKNRESANGSVQSMPIVRSSSISPTGSSFGSSQEEYDIKCPNLWDGDWERSLNYLAFLSVGTALDFRDWLGGEEAINNYTRKLAYDGGKLVSKLLGTRMIDNENHSIVFNMVNVELPITILSSDDKEFNETCERYRSLIENEQLDNYSTRVPIFKHGNILWARISAHIYNDISDFQYVGSMLKTICNNINNSQL